MPEIVCPYFPTCRGCDHWDLPYQQQKQNKLSYLRNLLDVSDEVFEFISIKPYGLRHRFDFTLEVQNDIQIMGLYGAEKKLIDLKECLQLSLELQNIFNEFRTIPMRTSHGLIRKASVRLRVSPEGQKGCWLDMANIDIKALLDDSTYLNQLLDQGFEIEIGQKGKKLARINQVLKLTDPQPQVWFRTQNFLLKSLISDFTQPSWFSGDALVQVVQGWTQDLQIKNAIEFGPGVGQFTLPLLARGIKVEAYENNPKAIDVLRMNAKNNQLENGLHVYAGDFQNRPASLNSNQYYDLALVNPPRSGLKNFVNTVKAAEAHYCIYISCFPESMQVDIEKLKEAGYKLKSMKIVDQFPQTQHFESCVLLEK